MATLIRPLRKTLSKTLIALQKPIFRIDRKIGMNPLGLHPPSHSILTRTYISEMRKAAFTETILRLIRNEIQYELDHSPPKQPVSRFDSFEVDERPGEQWISLTREFSRNEEIKVEATMFDGAIAAPKPGMEDAVQQHMTMIVSISKGDNDVLEFMCSAWPDSVEIKKLFIRRSAKMPAQAYVGPEFKELDDELQDSLYEYLEARGITDEMATFLHQYMKNKGKAEFMRWMGNVKSHIECK
ncbi:hypothetical protein Tsubulata_012153 [Turnera subulata]|uniref:Mitochondrial glycoprotein n=1 Tax=Turnera subulata TaxID=218843 RepID=A0A9Q0FF40_9ROSI|nr:hypothetical protein Tsubulata_012153 [Turnera subulata]